MIAAIFILIVLIAVGASWAIVARLPKVSARSRLDRIILGTVVGFGVVVILCLVWFVAGCIVRVAGVPPICT